VAVAELLMVQHHLSRPQPHQDGNAFVRKGVVLLVVSDTLVVVGTGDALEHIALLDVHGELMEIDGPDGFLEGLHAVIPVLWRQNAVVEQAGNALDGCARHGYTLCF